MKKLLVTAGIAAMAFLLSSCFVLQGFNLGSGALAPGKSTTVTFSVRPASTQKTPLSKGYQFVLIGVDTPADLRSGKATWGTNHAFGGPFTMAPSNAVASSIGTQCDASGFSFSSLTGLTWKGYITPNPIADHQQVNKKAVIKVALKALAGATSGDQVQVIGLTGARYDDGDGIVNSADTFACTGNGSASIFIK